jgi:hypothetical protein
MSTVISRLLVYIIPLLCPQEYTFYFSPQEFPSNSYLHYSLVKGQLGFCLLCGPLPTFISRSLVVYICIVIIVSRLSFRIIKLYNSMRFHESVCTKFWHISVRSFLLLIKFFQFMFRCTELATFHY